jgi:hypothetical protein
MAVIEELGYSKDHACWVPQMMTGAHKEERKATVTDLLPQFSAVQEEQASCHTVSQGMEPGSIILNQYPSGKQWTDTT